MIAWTAGCAFSLDGRQSGAKNSKKLTSFSMWTPLHWQYCLAHAGQTLRFPNTATFFWMVLGGKLGASMAGLALQALSPVGKRVSMATHVCR